MPSPAPPYTEKYAGGWKDLVAGGTPIDADALNHLEAGIEGALQAPTGPNPGDVPIWDPTANGGVGGWNVTTNVKLSLSMIENLSIVDADIADNADIAASKIAGSFPISKLQNYPADATQTLNGDGSWDTPPGYEFGYDEITGSIQITGTSIAAPTTIIAGSPHDFDGEAVVAEFFCPMLGLPAVVAGSSNVVLFEGATAIAVLVEGQNNAASSLLLAGAVGKKRFIPSAGAHTYSIKAFASSTTGTPTVYAGTGGSAIAAAYLRFTKV